MGHRVLHGAGRRRRRRRPLGPPRRRWWTPSPPPTRTPTTCQGSRCPRPWRRPPTPRKPSAAPRWWCSRSRRRRCAATSARWVPALPPDCVLVSLMKGIELGTTRRMSEVIAEVTGAGPERIAVVSGPNLAKEIALRQPAASVVACADEAVAEKLQQVCLTAYFRPVHEHRRARRRGRRGGEERHRAGRRHGQGHGDGRQLAGVDHHPRAGRDHPARAGARAPTPPPSRGSPGSATSSPPACRRCRATAPSARTSAGG